jgi:hypothetical protein
MCMGRKIARGEQEHVSSNLTTPTNAGCVAQWMGRLPATHRKVACPLVLGKKYPKKKKKARSREFKSPHILQNLNNRIKNKKTKNNKWSGSRARKGDRLESNDSNGIETGTSNVIECWNAEAR